MRGAQGERRDLAEVRRGPESMTFCQCPSTHLHSIPILPLARSLDHNCLADKGATALAAILNETKITHLRCAAIAVAFAFVSAPIDTLSSLRSHARRLSLNELGPGGGAALAEGIKGNTTLQSLE